MFLDLNPTHLGLIKRQPGVLMKSPLKKKLEVLNWQITPSSIRDKQIWNMNDCDDKIQTCILSDSGN